MVYRSVKCPNCGKIRKTKSKDGFNCCGMRIRVHECLSESDKFICRSKIPKIGQKTGEKKPSRERVLVTSVSKKHAKTPHLDDFSENKIIKVRDDFAQIDDKVTVLSKEDGKYVGRDNPKGIRRTESESE